MSPRLSGEVRTRCLSTSTTLGRRIGVPNRKNPNKRTSGVIEGNHAYCSGDRCCKTVVAISARGVRRYQRATSWKVKNVPPGTRQCPDCSFALVWIKV